MLDAALVQELEHGGHGVEAEAVALFDLQLVFAGKAPVAVHDHAHVPRRGPCLEDLARHFLGPAHDVAVAGES